MKLEEAIKSLEDKFSSNTKDPVKEAVITHEEWVVISEKLHCNSPTVQKWACTVDGEITFNCVLDENYKGCVSDCNIPSIKNITKREDCEHWKLVNIDPSEL